MNKPLPEIIGRPTQQHLSSQAQVLAPFATSPKPYHSNESSSIEAPTAPASPGDISLPATSKQQQNCITEDAADGGDEGVVPATSTGKPLLLRVGTTDSCYSTGTISPVNGPPASGSPQRMEGKYFVAPGVPASGTSVPADSPPPQAQHPEPTTTWSLSPHKVNRHPLKPLHTPAAALVSTGDPGSSSLLSSTFSHKLRRRLQHATEDVDASRALPKPADTSGPEGAAAAAAAIAATVPTAAEQTGEAVFRRAASLRRCTSLTETPSLGTLTSDPLNARRHDFGQNSSGAAVAAPAALPRSISLSPYSSPCGRMNGTPRPMGAPMLRQGSNTSSSAKLGIAYRSECEIHPRGFASGGGASSSTGKVPVPPVLRLPSSDSPTLSGNMDGARFLQRSPSVCSVSDADPEGSHSFLEEDEHRNLFGSGSGGLDDAGSSPVLGLRAVSVTPPNVVGRGLKERAGWGSANGGSMVGGGGVASRARQQQYQRVDSIDSTWLETHDSLEVALENADTPKLNRQKSHFGSNPRMYQDTSSGKNSGGKRHEARESEGKHQTSRNSDNSEGRRCTPSNDYQHHTSTPQLPASSSDLTLRAAHQHDGQLKPNDHEQVHACPVFGGRSGDEEKGRRVVQPTTPKMGAIALPEQTTPKLGSVGRAAERGGSRQHGCKKTPKAGGAGAGGGNLPASFQGGGGAPATSSTDSHLVRRNDSILRNLFSGGPDGGARHAGGSSGSSGSSSALFSHEFGLWKRTRKASPRATETKGGRIEAELPPPPLQGADQAVVTTENEDGGRGEGVRDGAVRPSLALTRAPPVGGTFTRRSSSPPNRTAQATLPVVVMTSLSTPTHPAKRAGGGEDGNPSLKDAVSPSPILQNNSFSGTWGAGRSPSPRLSPRAARAKNRLCTEALVACDSGPGAGGPGRLLGRKASPPPSSGRFYSAFRVEGSAEEVRIGRGEEEDHGSSIGSRSSRGGVGSDSHRSHCDFEQHTTARAKAPCSPPPLLLEGSHFASHTDVPVGHASTNGCASLLQEAELSVRPLFEVSPSQDDVGPRCHPTADPVSRGASVEILAENATEYAEVVHAASGAPSTPNRCRYQNLSAEFSEGLSVDVTEDLSVELNCRDRSIDGQHTAASASYDEDGQWAADKGCHTCVSRHPHRAIRWKRGEQIGMGSFGKVFKGLNESTGELFAVKEIAITHGSQEEIDTLETELALMKDLNHKHIVRYCGTERGGRHLYIFLEYVPGGSIASMLQQFGVFKEDLVRRFVHQILLGMCYLHDKGIIHRDIKGANVLVTEQGIAKLADFGCSKQFQGVMTPSFDDSLHAMRGSVPWMAPEMIKQSGHGRSADVWSVGATMIEMCTARYPWPPFTNNMAAMYHVATATEPPKFPENVSELAKNFLSNCLIIDPDGRMKAAELLQHAFLDGAAQELEATSGLGPGGFGSSGGMAEHSSDA